MKYFSMFSGIGGFEIGIQQAYKCYGNAVTTNVVREVIKRLYAKDLHSQ